MSPITAISVFVGILAGLCAVLYRYATREDRWYL